MTEKFVKHLEKNKFNKTYPKLVKKLSGKSVVIYGTGKFFRFIKENYDLSGLNIIGVSDGKYIEDQEGQEDLGYKIIPKTKIKSYKPDVVLITMQEYFVMLEDFSVYYFKNTGIKVYPLVKQSLWTFIYRFFFV